MAEVHTTRRPYYSYNYTYQRGGGRFFSRMFWFALGAGAMSYWYKKSEEKRRIEATAYASGTPTSNNAEALQARDSWFTCTRREMNDRWNDMQPTRHFYREVPKSGFPGGGVNGLDGVADGSVAAAVRDAHNGVNKESEWKPPHFKDVSRQTGDAMVEISEQALDTLIGSITALKAKLLEVREEREKMYLEQRLETPEDDRERRGRISAGDSKINIRREFDDERETRRVV